MLILHAASMDARMIVWGETTPEESAKPKKGRRKKSAEAFPYDPGIDRCLEALGTSIPELDLKKVEKDVLTLWLPSTKKAPMPSSPLIASWDGKGATLQPWEVSVIVLSLEQSIVFLSACAGKEILAPGIVVGKSPAYWSGVLRFAGSLVARQQYLPGMTRTGEEYVASWEPLLAADDRQKALTLENAMPAVCRALMDTPERGQPQIPAAFLLNRFLGKVVDHLVRTGNREGRPAKARKRTFDSVHDAWLDALRSSDGVVRGAGTGLQQLTEQIDTWRRPIILAVSSPFRLCFRLEEPATADSQADHKTFIPIGEWQVRFLLQGVDDPSLLIPVEEAWAEKGKTAKLFQSVSFHPREYLLSSLGRAALLAKEIEGSLKSAQPTGYTLDATGAHTFLTQQASLLEQAGFGVLFPAWWTRKGTKKHLTLRAHVKSPIMTSGAGLTLDEIVKFEWRVALGETELSLAELETLAGLKTPLVRLRGEWVQLSADEIEEAIQFWKKQDTQTTVREVVRMAVGVVNVPATVAFGGVTAVGWVNDFLTKLEGRTALEERVVPAGFQGTLRPYQQRGFSWLSFLRNCGLGACLADDMGLGKTVQTLAMLQYDREQGNKKPVLLICPMSVVGNWQKEAGRFTPQLSVVVHHGSKRARSAAAFKKEIKGQALVLSSYAILHRDHELLRAIPWSAVILDEAQNVKNPETKQSKAARGLSADFRIALTGTPVENHVGDLWSIMEFLNPGFLGTQSDFRRNFWLPIQTARDREAGERLKKITGPFVLRRLKTDKSIISDLPEKLEMKVYCTLTKEQASLYAAVVKEAGRAIDESEGIQRKGVVLATLSKLKQVCNHPAHFLGDNSSIPDRSGKLSRLTEMLEEVLEAKEKSLIFTQFTEMGEILRKHLQEIFGKEVLFLHGGVSKPQRDAMVERFQSPDGPEIFLLSLKAGGTGLNLTSAAHVFHFDRWWNPAVENQATDRAYRIGQTRTVQVHKFICMGTIEEKVDEMIERKKDIAGEVVGTGEGWLTELSTDELKELFTLRTEAVFGE